MATIQTRESHEERGPREERPARGEGRDRDRDDDDRGRRGFGGGFNRKKVCRFCADTEYVLDYKDIRMMQSFMTEHGKVVPRRISGNCAHHQRKLTTSVKRARNLALVGYVSTGN